MPDPRFPAQDSAFEARVRASFAQQGLMTTLGASDLVATILSTISVRPSTSGASPA